jgi:ribosome biogenesis GTPase
MHSIADDSTSIQLEVLGWSDWFDERFSPFREQAVEPGRVAAVFGAACAVETASGPVTAELTGTIRRHLVGASRPAVGDWVAVERDAVSARIRGLLPRRTMISRKAAGETTDEQVVAANVDLIFIVSALAGDLNLRRLERYLTIAYESGAEPVVVLTKADLGERLDEVRGEVEAIAPEVSVIISSSVTGEGLDLIGRRLRPGVTAILIGSSGVGKTTLINHLSGADLRTSEVRADGKGRHTTTRRELIRLPWGGMIIDTPGLREIQLWHADEGLGRAFSDVEELAQECRFNDCRHDNEPACGVKRAIEEGRLAEERLASYRKLERELRSLRIRSDVRLQAEERKRWKAVHKAVRPRP